MVSVIQIVNNRQIGSTIVGIYLPFLSGTSCKKYKTLDEMHAIIDNVDSPVTFLSR